MRGVCMARIGRLIQRIGRGVWSRPANHRLLVRFAGLAALLSLLPALPVLAESDPAAPLLSRPAAVERALRLLEGRKLAQHPDDDSKASEGSYAKLDLRTKFKDCCGYPLGERGTFKMTFYWLAFESEYANEPYLIDIYTRHGFVIGRFPRTFVFEFKLEGSAVLRDGRVLNYDGRCPYGVGFCFQTLDPLEHPLGKGGQGRALLPYRSVAVDPRFVPLGTPLFLPELAGLIMPDGSRHDGCVRADDTGGNIRRRELDFFVESFANYKFVDEQLAGDNHVTPYIEVARCAYLRGADPSLDRRSEQTDWEKLHERKPPPRDRGKAKPVAKSKSRLRDPRLLTGNKGAALSPKHGKHSPAKGQRASLTRRS